MKLNKQQNLALYLEENGKIKKLVYLATSLDEILDFILTLKK